MGDRTTVDLYVPSSLKKLAESLFGREGPANEEADEAGLASFTFIEVGYGELHFLKALFEHGIAYDSCWSAGDDYGAGSISCRFDAKGEVTFKEVYNSDANPNLGVCIKLIDKPAELRQYILDHQRQQEHPSWDNQVEYGRIFLTKQLIS